jgi:sugar lactone lactonase YvrE
VPEHTATSAIAPYNGKLYALSPSGQIYRYQRSGQEMNSGSSWLKQQPAKQNPIGIAVDGSVYVLNPDGIQKFTQGAPASLNLGAIYPVLSQATSFSVQTKGIYVLEPANQRIVIFTKAGQLDHQYTSPDLANATAIAVDTAERTAYVSAGATVLKIDLAAR